MRKTIWAGTFSAFVGAATIALLAQAPTPQQTQPPNTSASSAERITVTGCLKAAPPAAGTTGTTGTAGSTATGTTGTSGAAGAAGAATDPDAKFVLTDATVSPAADNPSASTSGSTAGETAGSTAAGSAAGAAQTYRLVANPASLSPHVGKKLELTGTVVSQSESTSTGSAASSGAAGSTANTPALKVEAGKVIAASCQE